MNIFLLSFILTPPCSYDCKSWSIPSGISTRSTNQGNGSCIYQLMLKQPQVLPYPEFSDNPPSISTPEQVQHNEASTDIPSAPSTSIAIVEKCKHCLSDIDLLGQPMLSKPTKAPTQSTRRDKKSSIAKEKQLDSNSNHDDDINML